MVKYSFSPQKIATSVIILSIISFNLSVFSNSNYTSTFNYIHNMITTSSYANAKKVSDSTFTEKELELLKNTSVTLIGDSVALGSKERLQKLFKNSYIDCKISRQFYAGATIIKNLNDSKKLNEILIVALGSNGPIADKDLKKIYDNSSGKTIIFVNCIVPHKIEATNNKKLSDFAKSNKNVYIVDWYAFAKNKPKLFYNDKTHPMPKGANMYADLIAKKVIELKS